jgi:hypothetical protein
MSKKADNLAKQFKRFGLVVNKEFVQIGFALDHLGPCQSAYVGIVHANDVVKNNVGINVSMFFVDSQPLCVDAKFATYNIRDTANFKGNLIATSITTAKLISKCYTAKRYFYILDLNFDSNDQKVLEILRDDNIIKFTRSKDYLECLANKGFKINPKIVNDFNINEILEIIKNG